MLVAGIRLALFAKERRHFHGGHFEHFFHSRNRQRASRVEFLYFPAEDRRPCDHCVQHPRNFGVNAVMRFADHDVLVVHTSALGAHDAIVLRIFQRNFFRHRHRSCFNRELTIRRFSPCFLVFDHAAADGATFVFRHTPSLGGRGEQHFARGSAGFAQRIPRAAYAHAAAGSHVAILWIAIALLDFHACPIGVEFFCKNHRKRRAHALSHLRARHDQANFTLRIDEDICVWLESFSGAFAAAANAGK